MSTHYFSVRKKHILIEKCISTSNRFLIEQTEKKCDDIGGRCDEMLLSVKVDYPKEIQDEIFQVPPGLRQVSPDVFAIRTLTPEQNRVAREKFRRRHEKAAELTLEDCEVLSNKEDPVYDDFCVLGIAAVWSKDGFMISKYVGENALARSFGVKPGDEIVSINGKKAWSVSFVKELAKIRNCTNVRLEVKRISNGRVDEVELKDYEQACKNNFCDRICYPRDVGDFTFYLDDSTHFECR